MPTASPSLTLRALFSQSAARAGLDTSSAVTAGLTPAAKSLAAVVTAGQRHESTQLEPLMQGLGVRQRRGRPRKRPLRLVGDRGYSHGRIRRWLSRRAVRAVIPTRKDQRPVNLDADAYRRTPPAK